MDYYMIVLEGQGDTYVKIVDKETWDWITNKDNGRVNSAESGWNDQTCPLSVRTRLWESAKQNQFQKDDVTEKPEDFLVFITIGSWKNDRALLAPAAIINNEKAFFFSVLETMKWCQKNNITPLKEYEGYIY